MNSVLIAIGLVLGIGASPHCIAMCGSPCAALTAGGPRDATGFQVGRMAGYMAGGAVAGSSGALIGLWTEAAPVLRPFWILLSWGSSRSASCGSGPASRFYERLRLRPAASGRCAGCHRPRHRPRDSHGLPGFAGRAADRSSRLRPAGRCPRDGRPYARFVTRAGFRVEGAPLADYGAGLGQTVLDIGGRHTDRGIRAGRDVDGCIAAWHRDEDRRVLLVLKMVCYLA